MKGKYASILQCSSTEAVRAGPGQLVSMQQDSRSTSLLGWLYQPAAYAQYTPRRLKKRTPQQALIHAHHRHSTSPNRWRAMPSSAALRSSATILVAASGEPHALRSWRCSDQDGG